MILMMISLVFPDNMPAATGLLKAANKAMHWFCVNEGKKFLMRGGGCGCGVINCRLDVFHHAFGMLNSESGVLNKQPDVFNHESGTFHSRFGVFNSGFGMLNN